MTRSRYLWLSSALLLLLLAVSVWTLRWLLLDHLVELLRPVAILSVASGAVLLVSMVFMSLWPGAPSRRMALTSWLVPAAAAVLLLAAPIVRGLPGPDAHPIMAAGAISPSGRLIAIDHGTPGAFYSDRWYQSPIRLLDTETRRQFRIGVGTGASHTPNLVSLAFGPSGCRAYWLRLRPRADHLLKLLRLEGEWPSHIAESQLPADLIALDLCAGDSRPVRTGVTLPSLEVRLEVLGESRFVAAHTEERLWIYERSSWHLAGEYAWPRDMLRYWVTEHAFRVDGSRVRVVRKQYLPSRLETLEVDIDEGGFRRVSMVDLQLGPDAGFDQLLAVDDEAERAVVHRNPAGALPQDCDFEIYGLSHGDLRFAAESAACGMVRPSALFLESGQIALADLEKDGGLLRLADGSGAIVRTARWDGADFFLVVSELAPGAIVVWYRGQECSDDCIDLFDVETGDRTRLSSDSRPIGPSQAGLFVRNRNRLREIYPDLGSRVILDW